MSSTEGDEILNRWKGLEDVEKERDLFKGYLAKRDAYLFALSKHTTGSATTSELVRALDEELKAFDAYVDHRTNSSYRRNTGTA